MYLDVQITSLPPKERVDVKNKSGGSEHQTSKFGPRGPILRAFNNRPFAPEVVSAQARIWSRGIHLTYAPRRGPIFDQPEDASMSVICNHGFGTSLAPEVQSSLHFFAVFIGARDINDRAGREKVTKPLNINFPGKFG